MKLTFFILYLDNFRRLIFYLYYNDTIQTRFSLFIIELITNIFEYLYINRTIKIFINFGK